MPARPSRRSRAAIRFVGTLAAWLGGLLTASAQAPSLAHYVSPDAAAYFAIDELDAHWTRFDASEFGRAWLGSSFVAKFRESPAGNRWPFLDGLIQEATGRTLTDHLRRLTGRSVAVAMYLPEQGEPQGVLLARGLSAEVVAETIAAWNQLEQPVRLEPHAVAGVTYYGRAAGREAPEVYYVVQGDLFVLSDREALVRATCARLSNDGPERPATLAGLPEFQAAWPKTPPPGTLIGLFAPRRWDRVLDQLMDETPAAQAILAAWRGTRTVSLQLTFNPEGLHLACEARFPSEGHSAPWRELTSASSSNTLTARAPVDAWLVLAGSFPPAPWIEALRTLMELKDLREFDEAMRLGREVLLGRDPWTDVGRALCTDMTVALMPRPLQEQQPIRRHPFVVTWESRWPQLSRETWLALENGVSFGLNLANVACQVDPQGPPVTLRREEVEATQRWLLRGRPEGELAVALSAERFRLSTSVAELDRSYEAHPGFTATRSARFPAAQVALWGSLAELRASDWSSLILADSAEGSQDERQLRWLLRGLVELFDEGYAAASWSPESLRVDIGAVPRANPITTSPRAAE
jgi:hypothetical protein